MGMADRPPSEEMKSDWLLSKIEAHCFGKEDVAPMGGRFMDRGMVATFMGDETGTYQVMVKRVSSASPLVRGKVVEDEQE